MKTEKMFRILHTWQEHEAYMYYAGSSEIATSRKRIHEHWRAGVRTSIASSQPVISYPTVSDPKVRSKHLDLLYNSPGRKYELLLLTQFSSRLYENAVVGNMRRQGLTTISFLAQSKHSQGIEGYPASQIHVLWLARYPPRYPNASFSYYI